MTDADSRDWLRTARFAERLGVNATMIDDIQVRLKTVGAITSTVPSQKVIA